MPRRDPKKDEANGVLHPAVSLLCKLGSVVVHADEMTSPSGHPFDKHALDSLLKDKEVLSWLSGMRGLGLVPEKR